MTELKARTFAKAYYDHLTDGEDNVEDTFVFLRRYGYIDENDEWIYDDV